jgi:hypothetical protein
MVTSVIVASSALTMPSIGKKVTGCVARNVISVSTKYSLVRKARSNSFVVDVSGQKCTVEFHLSRLIGKARHLDMHKIRII